MREIVVGTSLLQLGERIGRGGEGEVFAVTGRTGQAVKIYGPGLRSSREGKIRAMVLGGLAAKTDLVAYPGAIATDPSGHFLGFLMRLVSGYLPLHELYSPKSRLRHFPKADYRFVVRAALNVARAIEKVHQTGCVIGDLNHSGVLVSQEATIALIDADSFQFSMNGTTYPCLVGVEDFTPPELHGFSLGSVTRTRQHDNFGLAVALFHLLFMGRHPYAGIYNGPDLSMGESIAKNRFAFSLLRRSETQTSPPPGALTLNLFPEPVSSGFERAFGLSAASRPSAADWVDALSWLEGSLNQCNKVKSHFYPSTAQGCIWCRLAAKSGIDMFPDLAPPTTDIHFDPRGTEDAIREINAFRFPTASELLPPEIHTPLTPSGALRKAQQGKVLNVLVAFFMFAGALAGFIYLPDFWYIWLVLTAWGLTRLGSAGISMDPFFEEFERADSRVQTELLAFARQNNLPEIMQLRANLAGQIAAYKRIDGELSQALNNLKSSREARQRAAFLDRFQLRRANISGIGPAKTATLISFGIETAADVDWPAVLAVPGIGDVMARKLLGWKQTHEARFRYDPALNAQDEIDEREVRSKYITQKAKLETQIRDGRTTLQRAKSRFGDMPSKIRGASALRQALEDRQQAEKDLRLLGRSVPASKVSLDFPVSPHVVPPLFNMPSVTVAQPRPAAMGTTPNCPKCGSLMRRKNGHHGPFWGCSHFPSCRGTRNI